MDYEKKSNRAIYAENRARYYDKVISMFESGMIAKDIVKVVPIGKSTVYRWYDEYSSQNKDANIRKSPKEAAETIKQLRSRIEQLETLCSIESDCIVLDKGCAIRLLDGIDSVISDFTSAVDKLHALKNEIQTKL